MYVNETGSRLGRVLAEAKRRKVLSVAAMYVVGAWVVLQVADTLFPAWEIPDQAMQLVVYAVLLGFPIALVFGWRYDLSSAGIRRTPPSDGNQGEQRPLGRSDYLLLALMLAGVIAIGAWLYDRLALDVPVEPPGPPNSVAVLDFASGASEVAPALAGLSSEVVSALIRVPGLKVTGRESSFYFRDRAASPQRIARMLGVRHLLTGRIHGGTQQPSLSLQLLRMPDGEPLWARTFDAALELEQGFLGMVANEIAASLGVMAPGRRPAGAQANVERKVLDLERLARHAIASADWDRAVALAEEAAELAPDYARGQVTRALAYLWRFSYTGRPSRPEMLSVVGDSLDRAEQLGIEADPDYHYARAIQARRQIHAWGSKPALEKALEDHFRQAIALNPSDAQAYVSWSIHYRRLRRYAEAAGLLERALEFDPLHHGALAQYSRNLSALGRKEEAFQTVLKVPELHGRSQFEVALRYREFQQLDKTIEWLAADVGLPRLNRHRLAGAWASMGGTQQARRHWQALAEDPDYGWQARAAMAAMDGDYLLALEAARGEFDPAAPDQVLDPQRLQVAAGYALHAGQPDTAIALIERAVPDLRDPLSPRVTELNMESALLLSCALNTIGQAEVRAGILASQALNLLRDRPAIGWDGAGSRAAQAYACLGDKDKALSSLAMAVEQGLRDIYLFYGQLPYPLEQLRGVAEFDRLLGQVNRDLSAMRERAASRLES